MHSDTISIIPFSPQSGNTTMLAGLVECYRDLFSEDPWNEWLKCNVHHCRSHWGKKDAALLASMRYLQCDKPVVEYWPRHKVAAELREKVTNEATCLLVVERDEDACHILGFTWGFPIRLAWSGFEPEVREALSQEFGTDVEHDPRIVYQREIGVISSHRKLGLARALARARNENFLAHGYRIGVLKTLETPQPSVTFLWYTKLGFRVVYRYPATDGRVILARELTSNLFGK